MALPLFDAHCDTLTRPQPLKKNRCHVDLERLGAYTPAAQVFALWAPPDLARPVTFHLLMQRFRHALHSNEDTLCHCRSAADVRLAAARGKIAAFLSVEGADLLGCRVSGLTEAHRQGVRLVNLCWNRSNALCGAAMDAGGGLTEAGRRFVEAAWKLGVAIDLSHASEATFWDVLAIAKRPVLCSHSNAKALCNHPRNLSDGQISALIRSGGVIGLNLCPDFLGLNRDVYAVLAHAEHMLARGAAESLCLGCDLDGIARLPGGIEGVESLSRLYEAMLAAGFGEELVKKIFYGNLLRFMEEAL